MGHQTLITKGKRLAYLLRHDKDYSFDCHGWREVSDLIKSHGYTMAELEEIVRTDNKGRYEFSPNKRKVRALQGHSIDVDVELEEKVPPEVLYHGTATRFLESIYREGILSKGRKFVHLSPDEETAVKVGARHGTPFVLRIDAKSMAEDGIKFYLSRNNVWLTKFVDSKYILK